MMKKSVLWHETIGIMLGFAALLFLTIVNGIALLYGNGKVLLDFNSRGEGIFELALSLIGSLLIYLYLRKGTV